MKRLPLLWLIAALAGGFAAARAEGGRGSATETLDALKEREAKIKEVIARVTPAVVAITSDTPIGTGSGVVVDKTGLILTAAHVTDALTDNGRRKEVSIIFPDGTHAKGEVLGANRTCDAAMVRITDPALRDWPHVALGASDEVAKGTWVVAMGQPGGFDPARTPPVRAGRVWGRDNFGAFFTDCTLIGGDSGGPLFDLEGRLIGIHSSIGGPLTTNRHIGIDNFRCDWDRMAKGEAWGYLTLGASEPDRPVIGAELDEESREGVKVLSIISGGPAEKAGLRAGDVITRFAGAEVKNYLGFVRLISRQKAGDTISLTISREGSDPADIAVALLSRQSVRHLHMRTEPPAKPHIYLGAEVENAAPSGASVLAVDPGSPAEKAGLAAGDLIVQIDGADLGDVAALAQALAQHQPGAQAALRIRRGDAEIDLTATLAAPPPHAFPPAPSEP